MFHKKKMLIVLIGETFRNGGRHSRERGTEDSVRQQTEACLSMMRFISHIETHNEITCSIALQTYQTPHYSRLIDIYSIHNLIFADAQSLTHIPFIEIREKLKVYFQQYDYILFTRPDLYFKKLFLKDFIIQDKRIMFTNLMRRKGKDMIADMIMFIPKSKFYVLDVIPIIRHHTLKYLIDSNYVTNDDVLFMSDNELPTNTQTDWNPYFIIVNRPVAPPTRYWKQMYSQEVIEDGMYIEQK